MEMHNVSERGNAETYLIQSTDVNQLITSTPFAQVESMYNEGAPEFVADQGLYYPTATNYGYYCTGFGAPSDWEDQHRFFGVDGPDFQYTGMQSENMPYVYYTPSYGYAESPYNPYNPYIPGAMVGVDGPFVGAQQYYSVPSYQNSVSSAYIPVLVQPDMSSPETLSTPGAATTLSRPEGRAPKNNFASASANASRNSSKTSSIQASSFSRFPELVRDNMGQGKPAVTYGGVSAGSLHTPNSSRVLQGRGASSSIQSIDNNNNVSAKVPTHRSQLKIGFPDFSSGGHGWATVEKPRQKPTLFRVQGNVNGNADASGEQNRGPRTNRARSQLAVKAYTTTAGNSNAQGIIIIDSDQYNKDDFPVDYEDAKFFVIKSYSEDDVHKSIKYNVWSSTIHGNKKLQNAYEDAQRIAAVKPKGCPIFLFFSVNASGMFCGVAEMIGPVDFRKDMDFWQQDKWSGSFPVKWHIIKDVQNTLFRHIILENNENKPVTNSRDTQEIIHKQGLEMLKIFKNHAVKTSLLDDFMYYENRQKEMQEERARVLLKGFPSPFSMSAFDPPRKLFSIVNEQPNVGKFENKDLTGPIKNPASENELVLVKNDISSGSLTSGKSDKQSLGETKDDVASGLKIGSLTINPKEVGPVSVSIAANAVKLDAKQAEIVTVGTMPVKVNGFNELTVGTIPLDPRVLQSEKKSVHVKRSSPKFTTKKSP